MNLRGPRRAYCASMNAPCRFALTVLVLLCACVTNRYRNEDALASKSLEFQLNEKGRVDQIEYHIAPAGVPEAVRAAMTRLHPDGTITGAEKEWHHGTLYYELTSKKDGRETEVMFYPDGTVFRSEIEVPVDDVPQSIQKVAAAALPGAEVTKYEEIREADGRLIEYHVKLSRDGKRYKLLLHRTGVFRGLLREIPAEVEVPAEAEFEK